MSLLSAAASSGGFWTIVFVLVISLAYVLGHLFYRQDPKNPDHGGFQRLVDLGLRGQFGRAAAEGFAKVEFKLSGKRRTASFLGISISGVRGATLPAGDRQVR